MTSKIWKTGINRLFCWSGCR